MIIIAHRGASLQCPENTIQAFHYAADHDADVIEIDIRRTLDGAFIIFHDETLARVDGSSARISELTFAELNQRLETANWPQALSLDQLARDYQRKTPLLFHIKITGAEPELAAALDRLQIDFYLGVAFLPATAYFSRRYGKRKTLAFMPQKQDANIFMEHGAGIIRLWEQWLDQSALQRAQPEPTIAHCKQAGAAVWIMTRNSEGTGLTNAQTLTRLAQSGADGALLNDVHLGRDWKSRSTVQFEGG